MRNELDKAARSTFMVFGETERVLTVGDLEYILRSRKGEIEDKLFRVNGIGEMLEVLQNPERTVIETSVGCWRHVRYALLFKAVNFKRVEPGNVRLRSLDDVICLFTEFARAAKEAAKKYVCDKNLMCDYRDIAVGIADPGEFTSGQAIAGSGPDYHTGFNRYFLTDCTIADRSTFKGVIGIADYTEAI